MTHFGFDLGWCVLRMSGPSTLNVAAALSGVGIETWAPSQMVARRGGRLRKRVERPAALLPSFVFARAERIGDLAVIAASPSQTCQVWDSELRRMVTKGVPHFSVMRHDGRYITVSDRSLDALRLAEQRGRPLTKVRLLEPGESVKCPDAGFDGLVGIVQTTRGRNALVLFDGFAIPVTIPTTSLLPAA